MSDPTATDPRIDFTNQLFAAWSSGDVDRPEPFFHPDGVLYDIVGGEHVGWPAIRSFFDAGIRRWPDLELVPDQYWTNDEGVALTWVMAATVTEASGLPAEAHGKRWESEGMSWLVIEDGRVRREVDYHDSAAAARALGLQKGR